jgi:hypothetical protein
MNWFFNKIITYSKAERVCSAIKQKIAKRTTTFGAQNHHCARKKYLHFSYAFWRRCVQVALVMTVTVPTFAASGLYVVSPDETTITSQITATTTNFDKTGSGVGIIAPSASSNSITRPVRIQAGTLQLNDTQAKIFGSSNAPTITIYGGATLASGYSSGITLSNPIVIGEGASKTGIITGLGRNGSGASLTAYPIVLTGGITQPLSNSGNSLTIAGGSSVTLSCDNTADNPLTGSITVNDSTTLNLNHANAIPSGLTSVVLGSSTTGGATLLATLSNTNAPAVALTGPATLAAASSNTLTASLSTGNFALTVGASGNTGTVVLTDSRTLVTNGVAVNYGLLQYSTAPSSSYTITIASGAAVQVTGNRTITNPLVFS